MENLYLERYAHPPLEIEIDPPDDLRMVVAIPAFKETDLVESLKSLASCIPTKHHVLVLVLINQSENCDSEVADINFKSYKDAISWAMEKNTLNLSFNIAWIKNMPAKHAGVGLARKIVMDEAVRLFEKLRKNRPNVHEEGLIVCFDADCKCDNNYLQEIEKKFLEDKNVPAAVIYYEHPLEGELDRRVYSHIAKYELFLRYHVNALRMAGFPYAFQTVGSCMAVRSATYQKQGGMNKKQAGEDFYFLQKLFPLKGFREINGTRVVPSPRISDRVPFGTGRTMGDLSLSQKESFPAYHPKCYLDIQGFIEKWKDFYYKPNRSKIFLQDTPKSINKYLEQQGFLEILYEMRNASPSPDTFYKKFFHWFNGFRVFKYIHFARDHFHRSIEIEEAANWLMTNYYHLKLPDHNAKTLLLELRKIDRMKEFTAN